eukprot:NODE_9624_length_1410_cov_5.766952.p1 GENE.NODE_9624_length_1410_cov_5.766952~~NODE_9624_length_1410_cov_5.766952.p1  ORF type:complete len:333 (+),score=70.34 NODE_9624_length_1410_cov_5.766952:207-1205(+)
MLPRHPPPTTGGTARARLVSHAATATGGSEQVYSAALSPRSADLQFAGMVTWRPHSVAALRHVRLCPGLGAAAAAARVGEPLQLTCEEEPIELLGDLSPAGAWTYPVHDEERRCYIGYLPASSQRTIHLRNLLRRVHEGTDWVQHEGAHGLQPRSTAWLVRPRCNCVYNYGGISVKPQRFPPWMEQLMADIMPLCGLHEHASWPNSCNLNLYESGGQSLGWHSDNERLFHGCHADCRIISLSLGQERKFQIRLKSGAAPWNELVLAHGDLCTMEGLTQKYYEHRVPPQAGIENLRINLTWRWIVNHTTTCRSAATRAVSWAPRRSLPQAPVV